MALWYYQIRGKLTESTIGLYGSTQNWAWPPLYSDKVEADSRELAIKLIGEQYNQVFKTRILKKDLESNEFLLRIEEMVKDYHFAMFENKTCKMCSKPFTVNDNYNKLYQHYKGSEYCSDECKQASYEVKRYVATDTNGIHPPVIYGIKNIDTGLWYVGKTTQAFTLRWYQHFFQSGDNKFHVAIKSSDLSHWTFQILEKVIVPDAFKSKKECEDFILSRERYWINHHDCINNGYNSI